MQEVDRVGQPGLVALLLEIPVGGEESRAPAGRFLYLEIQHCMHGIKDK